MINKVDIAIAYRIFPGISKVPPVFADDKLKLSELCLFSLKESLGDLNVKIFALLDNCPETYVDLFKKYFSENELEIIRFDGIGNAGTFGQQIKILLNQNYSEYIYFAEDDYFYLKNAIPDMLNFLQIQKNSDFVTSYYHPDYDRMKVHRQFPSKQIIIDETIWKTVASTTMTFLTTKTTLSETENIFLTYLKNNYDASIWFALTKHKLINPLNIFKYLFTSKLWFKIFLKSWIFTPKQILLGKKYNLFVPNQTASTHLDSLCLPEGVEWKEAFNDLIKKINFNS